MKFSPLLAAPHLRVFGGGQTSQSDRSSSNVFLVKTGGEAKTSLSKKHIVRKELSTTDTSIHTMKWLVILCKFKDELVNIYSYYLAGFERALADVKSLVGFVPLLLL